MFRDLDFCHPPQREQIVCMCKKKSSTLYEALQADVKLILSCLPERSEGGVRGEEPIVPKMSGSTFRRSEAAH